MTTQLPNGYEAVKVPEGADRFYIVFAQAELDFVWRSDIETGFVPLDRLCKYSVIGRAEHFKEEQCGEVVEQEFLPEAKELMWVYKDYLDTTELNAAYFFTALESFRSLLASLHLEPHTTIILKKENV